MEISWSLVGELFKAIVLLLVGAFIKEIFEKKSKLISYFGHVSAFKHAGAQGAAPFDVFTHTVVLRNSGRISSTNIRVHHKTLPDFTIYPNVVHQVETLSDGSKDIVIPILVPKEQITISYIYFPPLTYSETNAGVKSDQGFAQQIEMVLQQRPKKKILISLWALILIGLIAVLYLGFEFAQFVWSKL